MDDLEGKVAVVTGAASGIGRALADRWADSGMKVVLADIEQGPLDAARDELDAAGADVLAVCTDVADGDQVDALAAATIAHRAGGRWLIDQLRPQTSARYFQLTK